MALQKTIICTLFEGRYHFGVAALCNSLAAAGFKGRVYAGYRGGLPPWAAGKTIRSKTSGVEVDLLSVTADCELAFLPYDPPGHFTNFKPQLMRHLLTQVEADAQWIFYFDPDICVGCDWPFFEEWVQGGIALAEDIAPPMPEDHPRRRVWRRLFGENGLKLTFRGPQFANGGFVALARQWLDFLDLWQRTTAIFGEQAGGMDVSAVAGGRQAVQLGALACSVPDQDALNAAIEAYNGPVVLLGREAMCFCPCGPIVMTHALGARKPWNRRPLLDAIGGEPPTRADMTYLRYVQGPLQPYSRAALESLKIRMKLGRFLGRFYQRYL